MVEVEILGIVVTHQYGTLNTGDVLRTDAEFARHLVEDCGAAKYRVPAEASHEADADGSASAAQASAPDEQAAPVPAKSGRGSRAK